MNLTTSARKVSRVSAPSEGDDLARFLREHIANGASIIVLAHHKADKSLQPIDRWNVDELEDVEVLVHVVRDTVAREVDALRSAATYVVLALAKNQSEALGRYMFRVDAGFGWRSPVESKPDAALTEMALAHADKAAKLALGHSQGIFDQYERLIEQIHAQHTKLLDDAQKRIALLEGREQEALELRERMQAVSFERERQLAKDERRSALEKRAVDAFLDVAGKIVVRAAPSFLPAPKIAADASPTAPATSRDDRLLLLVEQFVTSLDGDQVAAFRSSLRDPQIAVLLEVVALVGDRFDARSRDAAPNDAAAEPAATPSPSEHPSTPKGTPS